MRIRLSVFMCAAVVVAAVLSVGEERHTGLRTYDPRAWPGYTLFGPISSTTTYLIDMDGDVVHKWDSDAPAGNAVYLLENGNLLRTEQYATGGAHRFRAGGAGGRVREIAPDGTVVWEFVLSSSECRLHHDVEVLPSGNVLMIAWEVKTAEEAVAAGRNPALLRDDELWPDRVIEVKPTAPDGGEIAWEWSVWDHLVQDCDARRENYGDVAAHPERVDVNYVLNGGPKDWNHTNSIAYNERLDQIVLSVHEFGEVWIVDHSTTTEQAAGDSGGRYGKGGDLLYRWGNPQAYRAGDASAQVFFGQHDAGWIAPGAPGAGHILVFNNGMGRAGAPFSTVDEIALPIQEDGGYLQPPTGTSFLPRRLAWRYRADGFYSSNISGAQRLINGNTLVCEGASGRILEVTSDGAVVWEYVNPFSTPSSDGPHNEVFKVRRYAVDDPGIQALLGP